MSVNSGQIVEISGRKDTRYKFCDRMPNEKAIINVRTIIQLAIDS